MTSTLPGLLPDAAQVADRAGVRILPLDTLAAVREAAALLAAVWRTDPASPPFTAEVMRAVQHAGGYVHGAYRGTRLVGASAGFLGLGAGGPTLHSHISGTLDTGRGIGLALKLHQRAWALERGITRVTWTFDPLVRRNAWFNLGKLGATGAEYLVDFYGPMTDGVNAGDASDRLYTVWHLDRPTPGALDPRGAVLALDDVAGAPVVVGEVGTGDAALVRLPADVEALRASTPATAWAWRTAVREVLVPALARGLAVQGMTTDGALVIGPAR